MIEVVPLHFDTAFKKAFGQKDVFCEFVRDLFGITLCIDTVKQEHEYLESVGHVKPRYDLFAEDHEQRIVVEIQHIKESDFFDRFLYYHLISLVEQVKDHKRYRINKTVYTVVILSSVPRDKAMKSSMATSTMDPIDENGDALEVYAHKLVFLNPRLVNEKTPECVKGWLELIDDTLDGQVEESRHQKPVFQKIIQEIKNESITPEELAKIKDESAWGDTLQDKFLEGIEKGEKVGIKKGEKIGIEKGEKVGIKKGEKIGIEKGEKIGIEKGEKIGIEKSALQMLKKGMDRKAIAEITGLSEKDLEELDETT